MLQKCLIIGVVTIAASLSGCTKPDGSNGPLPTNAPTITLADEHNQASGGTIHYSVPPSENLIVDASSYKIPIPEKLKPKKPKALHLIHGSNDYYRAPWNGEGKLLLDQKTLEIVKGTSPFSGFKSGETYVVGIGYDSRSPADNKLGFEVMWAGLITVK